MKPPRAWQVIRQSVVAFAAQMYVLAGGEHVYMSTSCLHDLHIYCQADKIVDSHGTRRKTPSSCKFCKARCICACHEEGIDEEPQPQVDHPLASRSAVPPE